MNKAVFALALCALFFLPDAHAEDTVCAAVLPCAEDGSVLKEFQSGPCEVSYRAACARFAAKAPSPDLVACIEDEAQLAARQKTLEKELSALKAKFRAARRSRSK